MLYFSLLGGFFLQKWQWPKRFLLFSKNWPPSKIGYCHLVLAAAAISCGGIFNSLMLRR